MATLRKMTLDLDDGVHAEIQPLAAGDRRFRKFLITVGKEQAEVFLRPGAQPVITNVNHAPDGSKLPEVAAVLNKLIFEGWTEYHTTVLTPTK